MKVRAAWRCSSIAVSDAGAVVVDGDMVMMMMSGVALGCSMFVLLAYSHSLKTGSTR